MTTQPDTPSPSPAAAFSEWARTVSELIGAFHTWSVKPDDDGAREDARLASVAESSARLTLRNVCDGSHADGRPVDWSNMHGRFELDADGHLVPAGSVEVERPAAVDTAALLPDHDPDTCQDDDCQETHRA